MSMSLAPSSSAFHSHARALVRLHELKREGKDDTTEAAECREIFEETWDELSDEEQDLLNELSGDLYALSDSEVAVSQGPAIETVDVADAMLRQRWADVLTQVRRFVRVVPPPMVSYIRGRAWFELGQPHAALAFMSHAASSDPNRVAYRFLELLYLWHVDEDRAVQRANGLLNEAETPGALLFQSADILWRRAMKSAPTPDELRTIDDSLGRALGKGLSPAQRTAAYLERSLVRRRLGLPKEAQDAVDSAESSVFTVAFRDYINQPDDPEQERQLTEAISREWRRTG